MNRNIKGYDYSFSRPNLSSLKADGGKFVIRYLTGSGKAITAQEVRDLHAHGFAIGVVYETTANRAAQGFAAGAQDARAARQAALGVGLSDAALYFAVDFDANPGQVLPYFQGVVSVLGPERAGVYAGYRVIAALDGHVKWLWQTIAWSAGRQYPGAHVYQHAPSVRIAGADVDVNYASAEAFGSFHRAAKTGPSAAVLRVRLKLREHQLALAERRAAKRAAWIKYLNGRIAYLKKQLGR